MKINDDFPSPKELKKNELEALKIIGSKAEFHTFSSSFSKFASDLYSYWESRKTEQRIINKPIDFESGFDIAFKNKEYHIAFGVKILTKKLSGDALKYEEISYSLCIIVKSNGESKLIRRFHFDYVISDEKIHQPVFHFQFPGENSPYLNKRGYANDHLHPYLSEPRIPCMPVTFPILINIVLSEFKDDRIEKIIQTPEWKKLIRDNENFIMKRFFENCNSFFLKTGCEKNLFTIDFYYGENF